MAVSQPRCPLQAPLCGGPSGSVMKQPLQGSGGFLCAALQGGLRGALSPACSARRGPTPGSCSLNRFRGAPHRSPFLGHTYPLAPVEKYDAGEVLADHRPGQRETPLSAHRLKAGPRRLGGPRHLTAETHPLKGKTCRSGRRGLLR